MSEYKKVRILYVECKCRDHEFMCLDLDTNEQIILENDYINISRVLGENLHQYDPSLSLKYWDGGGFREVINHLIKYNTHLRWYHGTDEIQIINFKNKFIRWLRWHNLRHKNMEWDGFGSCSFPDKRILQN